MITRTIFVILGYMCVAGFFTDAQLYCNSTKACPLNQECVTPYFCRWGVCGCPANTKANTTGTITDMTSQCVTPTKKVNETCTNDAQCMGSSYCASGVCSCIPNYSTAKSDMTDCVIVPKNALNTNCTSIPQCGLFATCDVTANNTCRCMPAYVPDNNIDCRSLKLNDPCSNTTDCPTGSSNPSCKNANCNSGTFQCNNGYHWVTSTTITFMAGCVPNDKSASVGVGQKCSDSLIGGSSYALCSANLACASCPEDPNTWACRSMTPDNNKGGASNVRLDIMALVSLLALVRLAA